MRRAGACRSLPDGHRTGVDGWQVEVEVLVLRLLSAGVLGHRWVRGRLPTDGSPDERAVQLVRCSSGLCHSTSWRQDRTGLLVLTYAAVPDPWPHEAAAPLLLPLVVTGGGALHPRPAEVDLGTSRLTRSGTSRTWRSGTQWSGRSRRPTHACGQPSHTPAPRHSTGSTRRLDLRHRA